MRLQNDYTNFYITFSNLPAPSFLCSNAFSVFLKKYIPNIYVGGAVYDILPSTAKSQKCTICMQLVEVLQPSWNEELQYIIFMDTSDLAILKWNGQENTNCCGIQIKLEEIEHISFLLKRITSKPDFDFSVSPPSREDLKELFSTNSKQIFSRCFCEFAFHAPLERLKVLNAILLDENSLSQCNK